MSIWGAIASIVLIVVWLSTRNQGIGTNLVVPAYSAPGTANQPATGDTKTGSPAAPDADKCLSEQCNIVGEHPNNPVPNGSEPVWAGPIYGTVPMGWEPPSNQPQIDWGLGMGPNVGAIYRYPQSTDQGRITGSVPVAQ